MAKPPIDPRFYDDQDQFFSDAAAQGVFYQSTPEAKPKTESDLIAFGQSRFEGVSDAELDALMNSMDAMDVASFDKPEPQAVPGIPTNDDFSATEAPAVAGLSPEEARRRQVRGMIMDPRLASEKPEYRGPSWWESTARPGESMEVAEDIGTAFVRFFTNTLPGAAAATVGAFDELLGGYGTDLVEYFVTPDMSALEEKYGPEMAKSIRDSALRGAGYNPDVNLAVQVGSKIIGNGSAAELYNAPEGMAPQVGQMIGQASLIVMPALVGSFFGPKGTAIGAGLGVAATSMMVTTAVGSAVSEYYEWTQREGVEYDPAMAAGLGILSGGAELLFNRLRIPLKGGKFAISFGQKGVERSIKSAAASALIAGIKANDPQLAAKMFKAAAGAALSEGAEEGVTEAFQTAIQAFYRGWGEDGPFEGVTLDEILESAAFGAVFGSLIGGSATYVGVSGTTSQMYGAGLRMRADASLFTPAEGIRIHRMLTDLGVDSATADAAVAEVKNADVRKTQNDPSKAKETAKAEESAVAGTSSGGSAEFAEIEDSDILKVATGDTRDTDMTPEQATTEAAARGILPTDEQKVEILGQDPVAGGAAEGDPTSPGLMGRAQLHAIARRLYEVAPALARRLRDKSNLTVADLALFLPGDEKYLTGFVRKALKGRIDAVVKEAAAASAERSALDTSIGAMEQTLEANSINGVPLTDAQRTEITAELERMRAVRDGGAAPAAKPTPESSGSTEAATGDPTASQRIVRDGDQEYDLDSMDLSVLEEMVIRFGLGDPSLMSNDEIRQAVFDHFSVEGQTREDGDELESGQRATIEAQMQEVEAELLGLTADPERELTAEEEEDIDSLQALLEDLEGQLGELDRQKAIRDRDKAAAATASAEALIASKVAAGGESESPAPMSVTEAYEKLDAIASDGDARGDAGEVTLLGASGEKETVAVEAAETEQEPQDQIDRLLARESQRATRRAREQSGDENATVVIRRATNDDIGSVAAKAIRAVRQIVRRGRKIVPIVVEGSHASTYSARGFIYSKMPDVIFVATTRGESKRLKQVVGNRIKNGRVRNLLRSQTENALFLSYVQTVLHENVHLDDKPGVERSRALVAVDQIIASMDIDRQRATLALFQGPRAAKEFSDSRVARELRAEILTDARMLRMIGINQILDANPAIGDEVINRLKYIMANLRGGQKLRQALIQDIIDVLNENTQNNGNTARRKHAKEMESGPVEEQTRQPNDDIRAIAASYAKANGIQYNEEASREGVVSVDVPRAKAIADLFEESSNQTSNAELLASYSALYDETVAQYEALKAAGYEMIPWGSPGDPYQNSAEMMQDVRENKRIYYYKTLNEDELSFGSDPAQVEEMMRRNPMLREAGGVINDSAGRPYQQTVNDLFRAVHDIFGHAKEGQQFGPRGEENAWRQHVRMFTPQARIAMSSETRGQNSWVNYGRHLRRADGTMPTAGDPDFIHPKDRPFADQKIVRLPSWATAENGLDVEAWPGAASVDGIEYQGRGHIGDRTSLDSITTNDLRDSIDPLLRSGMRELPYVENEEPTLSSGRRASDRQLRGVRNSYPVGTFTLEDMKSVRDKSVSILRAIFEGAPDMAASKFRSARNQILDFNSNEDFPVIDPAVMNDTFADETLAENHRFWYEASGRAMSERIVYTGSMTAGRLADYWSATSPQTNVLDNAKRGLAIAVDEEQRGTSRVGIPTPSLTRDAAGGRYESSRSNSYKASSFGDTMAMFAGSSRGIPMTTNDIWVSYYFGFRIRDPKTGKYGGDNSVYSDPYAYLYTSIYMSVLAEEINRRIEASPQYAAARARLNEGNGTLADEALVTPWTPWQVQAYPWSHLSDSGTFDDAIDSIGDLLASREHPSVSTVNGEHVIDLEKAVADSEFATILIPSAIPREDMVVPLEFGGADIGKGTERSARRKIDAILSDPKKQEGRTKKSIERIRTARGMIYKEIGSVLRLIGGSGAPSDHPGYATVSSFANWLVGEAESVELAKGNQFVHNLLAALMPTPSNFKELQAKHRELAREMDRAKKAKREPDEQLIASIQDEIAALQSKKVKTLTSVGVPTGPTAGAMQVIETPYLGAKSFALGVTGLDKAGRGFGGYYGGVFSPNVPISLFGLTAEGRQKFAAIIGAALGEQAVAGSRWYAGEQADKSHGRCVVFHAVGKSLTHDDIADLKRRIDADTRENGMWMSMQLNTIGTDVIVGNPNLSKEDFDAIFQANGFDRATDGYFEGIYVSADGSKVGPNYGIKRILSNFVRQDYAAGSQWRKHLTDSQRAAVAEVEALDNGRNVLRGLLAGGEGSEREVRNLGTSSRRALAAALRQSQSFRVHFSYGAIRREADAARERLNALVAPGGEVSNILQEEDIEYQIRVGLPTTKEHADFFRDSKIRKENGELMPVAHGTVWYDFDTYQTFQISQPFYRFDTNARGWYGRGTYFTENTRTSSQYATPVPGVLDGSPIPRTYVCYLNIKNPAVLDATGIPRVPGKRFRIVTDQVFEEFFQKNHPELLAEFKAERDRRLDKASLVGYGAEARVAGDVATDMLKELGYDGIIAKDVGQYRNETYYIAFEPEQIKSVFNETPGANPFIDEQRRVDVTSNEFKEWFGNSDVLDEQGDPRVVYHGTKDHLNASAMNDWDVSQIPPTEKDFTVFRTRTSRMMGVGAYFTSSPMTADIYAGSEQKYKASRIMPVYLRMENPFIVDGMMNRFNLVREVESRHPEVKEELQASENDRGKGMQQRGEKLNEIMRRLGYDGIIVRPKLYEGDSRLLPESAETYIVFDPNQIKSALTTSDTGPSLTRDEIDEQRRQDVSREEFKRWFQQSKAVDPDGLPTIVHHGTLSDDFSVFRRGSQNRFGPGTYFANDRYFTRIYSSRYDYKGDPEAGGRTYPVYVRINNPLMFDAGQYLLWQDVVVAAGHFKTVASLQSRMESLAGRQLFLPSEEMREMSEAEYKRWQDDTRDAGALLLKELGYDGIIVTNISDSNPSLKFYVTFDPEQVKSALTTSDTGPILDDPNIDMQRRDPDAGPVQNLAASVESRRNRLNSHVDQFRGMLTRDGLPPATVVVKRDDRGVPILITVNDTDPVGEDPVPFMHFDPSVGNPDSWYMDMYDAAMSMQARSSMWDGAIDRMDMDAKFLTEDDELAIVEYMARPALVDIESPMRSLDEIREGMKESGIRFGLSPRSLSRWLLSRLNQSFANEWQVLEAVVAGIEEETGRQLPIKYDPMRAIRLRSGVEAETLTQFSSRTKRRIEDAMLRMKVTSEEVGRYLAAKHALERNELIRRINAERTDLKPADRAKLNCGISDETAARLLEEHEASENAAAIEQIADMFREITHETALAAKHAGLISNEDFDRITSAYKFYVPMNVTGATSGDLVDAVTDRVDDALARLRSKRGSQYMGSTLDADTGRRSKLKYTLGRKESEETVRAIIRGATGAILVDRMATEREAITNRVANRLLRLAIKYPNNILKVAGDKDLTETYRDETTGGLVKVRRIDPESSQTDKVMIPIRLEETMEIDGVVRERGEIVYLFVTDKTLADKLQKGEAGQANGVVKALSIMARIPRAYTSLIRLTSTQWLTPDFTAVQPLLDGQTAWIEAIQDGRVTAKDVAKKAIGCVQTIFLSEGRRAMMPTAEAEAESPALGPYAEYYDEFRRIGGKQAWFTIQNVDAMAKVMESINGSGGKAALRRYGKLAKRFLFDSYNVFNDVGDNMWRLSFYITLRENGVDAETAAVAARNLTVDFSRKGDASAFISGMWSFFNATVQGNIRTKKQLFTGKKGLQAFTGIASIGLLSRLLMWAMGGYEDKDKNGVADFLEQVPEYKQRRNILIPYGVNDDGTLKIFTIPLNYGLEIPYLMGAGMFDVGMGVKSAGEVGLEVGTNIVTAFNPVAGTPMDSMHGILRSVAPDILDPVIDLISNRNFTGRRIYYGDNPIDSDNPTVRSEIGSARETYGIDWNQTAVAINHAFGGDEAYRSSMFTDMQPEAWQYLFGTLTGSTGRTLERLGSFSLGMYNYIHYDDPMPPSSTIPVVRRFVLDVNDNFYSTNYYIIRDRINSEQDRIEAYEDAGKRDKARDLMTTLDGSPRMAAVVKNAESQNRKIRKATRELDDRIRNMERGPERDALVERRRKFFEKQKELMRRVIATYTEKGGRL